MANVTELTTIEQLNEAIDHTAQKPLLVFKHSTRCPISAGAYQQFQSYLGSQPNEDVDYSLIYVVENRDVSLAAADALDVQHQSPQVILIKEGKPVWDTSHSSITADALRKALS
ncbi:bacillithiol system redox-active protein YtxJ [Paenibacillus campi]|uniref:bacillithiol system redox-active protein YtxJ n=1 Tax=Paenibacillus campi TaxID=3106031 RepID=UPI002AFEB008|nr:MULTISPECIES: bacillithiol system redox-active protein YtxJ [unclassified Paenibacillus]